MSSAHVVVNGHCVYLDADALRDGEVVLAPGGLSEQCGGCGVDIVQCGEVYVNGAGVHVRCDELTGGCGTLYRVVEEGT